MISHRILLILCAFHFCQSRDPLVLTGQEVVLPNADDDMTIQFICKSCLQLSKKAHVRNNGTTMLLGIVLRPERCCFYEDQQQFCQLFHPVGEKLGYLAPSAGHTLRMVYVNYYVLGRYGECNATLNYGSTVIQKVKFGVFNTTLSKTYTWLPRHAREWLTGSKKCSTVDQDIFRGCKPINCVYKYGGLRNYFDETTQLCWKTRECNSDPTSFLPKQRLNTGSNTCESFESNLTLDDMTFFYKEDESFMQNIYNTTKIKEVVCVHGKLQVNNQSCTCDYGWTSDMHDRSPYDPFTRVYYLCNTHALSSRTKLKKITAHMIKLLIFLVIFMLCACALSFIFFCCAKLWMVYREKKKGKGIGPTWFKGKSKADDEARKPLFGSSVQNQNPNAKVQHIETSWYSTEDSIYDKAVVHTKSKGKKQGELYLNPGDVLTDLEKVDIPGYWKGTCRDKRGIFPVTCAEFRRDGQPPTPLPKFSER